ncbi:hypothetical protein GCM10020367_41820 [Streptomyces sannanensis]|uniref:Uncharacterized protein n=1 Tax=Streptomyces sannanensis TaxID=285536 RepID=A0ABP6SEX3_9ACTN
MSRNRMPRLAALGAAPLLAMLTISPAVAAEGLNARESLPTAETKTAAAPSICHGLSQPADAYHRGCREGFLQGSTAGNRDGTPPICRKTLPPLAPVNPNDFERGKIQGYKYGYDQAYQKAYTKNCATEPEQPPQQQPPQQTQQTYESMFNAGKESGTRLGLEDGKKCLRTNANLTPPAKPDVLITAFQNGYRVGYDTAYDEAFRQNCQGKQNP